jgi:malonyl-ACP decarboxylase
MGVAITGLGVLAPQINSPDELSAVLRKGVPAGGLLTGFSAGGWAETWLPEPRAVTATAGRAALPAATASCVAVQALRHAGLTAEQVTRAALVVAGNNLALGYQAQVVLAHEQSPRSVRPSHAVTCLDTDAVGCVSEVTGLRGEGWTIGGACASGNLALIAAARLLLADEADHCLVVAPAAELSPPEERALRQAGVLAEPGAPCRPFDAARTGFVRGQGAAAVVLERTAGARRRNAEVLAILAGYGQRLDARRGTEPDPGGQALAMTAALDRARLRPEDIGYVNAHATGSVVGDPSEAAALLSVLGPGPAVNSTKALLGHCLSAAGLIEAVATVLQMRGGFVHPNPHLNDPIEPRLRLVGRDAQRMPVRAALSNSFAFGGINTAVVLTGGDDD